MAGGVARGAAAARAWGLRRWDATRGTPTGRLLERIVRELVAIEVFDRAMTLAAQAFTSIVPLMLVTAALRPDDEGVGSWVSGSLGLSDETRAALAGSVPDSSQIASTIGILGILVALISATSFARALERVYVRVWGARRPGLRNAWRWLATVLAVALATSIVAFTRDVVTSSWRGVTQLAVQALIWSAVFTLVPQLLLRRQLPRRPVVVTGVLTGVAIALLGQAGSVYLPLALTAGARQFGALGLVFAYLGWLFALALVVIACMAIGHACASDDGPVGRWVRGTGPDARVPTTDGPRPSPTAADADL